MKTKCIVILCLALSFTTYGQDKGVFSGAFTSNANFFLRDSLIGAAGIPQYDNQLFGADAWLDLNYAIDGFNLGVRFDLFNNSNLLNPSSSYTDQGIGRWYVQKSLKKLDFTVGYMYDQIGSGIIFRAYEERTQLIDQALYGAKVKYRFNDNLNVRGFTGKQKNLFDTFNSIIKGGAIEGYFTFGDEKPLSIAPGIGVLNRTMDDDGIDRVVNTIKFYISDDERFVPKYNVYLFSLYNTLSYGPITWFFEGAYKSEDTFFDPTATLTEFDGSTSLGRLRYDAGSVLYSTISFAKGKLGLTLEGKRTENFNFRADPFQSLNRGLTNFLPPMARQNTYRLTTRYSAATQDLSEYGLQLDARYRFNKKFSALINGSFINTLDEQELYRELYTEVSYKYKRKWQLKSGIQIQRYNQEVYEVKPEVPIVQTFTPFVDYLYKLSRKKSIRAEVQYMIIGDDEKAGKKQDYGDWFFGQIEYNAAPHWSFVVSDMYNASPGKNSPTDEDGSKLALHYPRLDVFYTSGSNRFGLSYVKQVEGVVCTGGICRLEPAFSGVKFSVNSTF